MRLVCLSVLSLVSAWMLWGVAAAAQSSDQTAALATVHQFVDSFNKGDAAAGEAACASPAYIIDEFPPHEWHGATACADWARAYDANAARNGITDGFVTMGAPWHADVTGDRAYVVMPVTYAYKQHGKAILEPHSVFTIVLRKLSAGWRITAWTWSKH